MDRTSWRHVVCMWVAKSLVHLHDCSMINVSLCEEQLSQVQYHNSSPAIFLPPNSWLPSPVYHSFSYGIQVAVSILLPCTFCILHTSWLLFFTRVSRNSNLNRLRWVQLWVWRHLLLHSSLPTTWSLLKGIWRMPPQQTAERMLYGTPLFLHHTLFSSFCRWTNGSKLH
jgi:hypothetical protein